MRCNESGDTSSNNDDQALNHKLTNQARSGGAKGASHRQLASTRLRANEKKTCHIDAGD